MLETAPDFETKYKKEIEGLDLNVGDSIYSLKSGTKRRILEKVTDEKYPGGGYFNVEVRKKYGTIKEEFLLFPKLLEAYEEGGVRIERLKERVSIFNDKGYLIANPGDVILSNKGARSKILSIDRDLQSPEESTVVIEIRKADGTMSDPEVLTFKQLKEAEKAGIISKIQKEDAGN